MLVNKWDLSKVTETQYAAELRYSLASMSFVPVLCVSARSGYNIRRSVDLVDRVSAQVRSELSTGVLNRVIKSVCEKQSPPMVKGRRLSIFYAVQTGTQPVTIRIFVNDPARMRPTYGSYLVGALRAAFGLDGAPVVLDLKARTQGRENDRGLEQAGGAGDDECGPRERRPHPDTAPARGRR